MKKPAIVILGAGLGGAIAAFEIKAAVGARADVSVVSMGETFNFVPSNPWVAVHWRKRKAAGGRWLAAGRERARSSIAS